MIASVFRDVLCPIPIFLIFSFTLVSISAIILSAWTKSGNKMDKPKFNREYRRFRIDTGNHPYYSGRSKYLSCLAIWAIMKAVIVAAILILIYEIIL